jgi:hypothetical protein
MLGNFLGAEREDLYEDMATSVACARISGNMAMDRNPRIRQLCSGCLCFWIMENEMENPTVEEFLKGTPLKYLGPKGETYIAIFSKEGVIESYHGETLVDEPAKVDVVGARRFYARQIPSDLSIPPFLRVTEEIAARRKAEWKDKHPPKAAAAEVQKVEGKRKRVPKGNHGITMVVTENPCIKGKNSHKQFELLKTSRSVTEFLGKGGHKSWVTIGLNKGWIKLS